MMGKIGCRPESYWGVSHLQALVFEPAHSVHCSWGGSELKAHGHTAVGPKLGGEYEQSTG